MIEYSGGPVIGPPGAVAPWAGGSITELMIKFAEKIICRYGS